MDLRRRVTFEVAPQHIKQIGESTILHVTTRRSRIGCRSALSAVAVAGSSSRLTQSYRIRGKEDGWWEIEKIPSAKPYSLSGGFGCNKSLCLCESSRNFSRLSANSKLRATVRQLRAIISLSARRARSVALSARLSASSARLRASAMCSPSRWSINPICSLIPQKEV
jgi:hypothetical protein